MPFRVLVADDSPNYRQALTAALGDCGFAVTQAEDGSAALRQLLETPFHLSLLDIHMPQLTGLQVLAQLKCAGLSVPSILMTGHPSRAIEVAALEAGAVALLCKPIPVEILRITVQQIVSQQKGPH